MRGYMAVFQHGLETELEGGGLVVTAGRRGAGYLIRGRRRGEATTLLEQMTARDQSPETLSFAIPLLRRISEATAGTEKELEDAGVLAKTLQESGRTAEAESEQRRIIAGAVSAGQFRVASAAAGDLLKLLMAGGCLPEALALNAETLKWTAGRGANDLELARTRFNDYGPLLSLGRLDECRALLQGCRAVFEREHDLGQLGNVYGALSDLQDKTGDRSGAIGFEQAALRFRHQAGDPNGCAGSHHNLSGYLERQGADPALFLAQRLAAAALRIQMGSGQLRKTIHTLAISDLPAQPPPSTRSPTGWRR